MKILHPQSQTTWNTTSSIQPRNTLNLLQKMFLLNDHYIGINVPLN